MGAATKLHERVCGAAAEDDGGNLLRAARYGRDGCRAAGMMKRKPEDVTALVGRMMRKKSSLLSIFMLIFVVSKGGSAGVAAGS